MNEKRRVYIHISVDNHHFRIQIETSLRCACVASILILFQVRKFDILIQKTLDIHLMRRRFDIIYVRQMWQLRAFHLISLLIKRWCSRAYPPKPDPPHYTSCKTQRSALAREVSFQFGLYMLSGIFCDRNQFHCPVYQFDSLVASLNCV